MISCLQKLQPVDLFIQQYIFELLVEMLIDFLTYMSGSESQGMRKRLAIWTIHSEI